MSITIRKIAEDLNLAVSTVSKALRDSYEIGDETKKLVLQYARTHNYVPNAYAGSLKNKKSKNIAIVLPEVADTFFSNAISGIDSVAQKMGYHVIVYLTHESAERECEILDELRGGRVDGVLISVSVGVDADSACHRELAKKIPVVFFDRICTDVPTAKVLTDDFESSYKATRLLLDRGCRAPAFLCFENGLSIVDRRKQGFLKALQEAQMDAFHTLNCPRNEKQSLDSIRSLLTSDRKIDGVVASVEKLAVQVYTICLEIGLHIPQDLKVIAFSNLDIAGLLAPSLSTVYQPAYDMGREGANLLFQALTKNKSLVDEQRVLASVLVERESTR